MSAASDPTPAPQQSIAAIFRGAAQEFAEDPRTKRLLFAAAVTIEMQDAMLRQFVAAMDYWAGHAPKEVSDLGRAMEKMRASALLLSSAAVQDRETPPEA